MNPYEKYLNDIIIRTTSMPNYSLKKQKKQKTKKQKQNKQTSTLNLLAKNQKHCNSIISINDYFFIYKNR